jgi:hypothetical protein
MVSETWACWPPGQGRGPVRVRGLAEDRHPPFAGLEEPDDQLQQGGLARAVRPDQAGHRARGHTERAVAQPPLTAVAPAQAISLECRSAAGRLVWGHRIGSFLKLGGRDIYLFYDVIVL